jgi:hypothetical protein
MPKPLRISVSNVRTLGSGYDEFSKDEITIFGYAITSAGLRYLIRPVNLGSYNDGDNRSFEANPIMLLDNEVGDGVDICAICLFLIERDNGDVVSFANGSLARFNTNWEEARQNLDTEMSTRERNLFAFAQSMIPMAYHVGRVNTWGDSDETYPPEFRTIPAVLGPGAAGEDGRFMVVRFNGNGFYDITLKYVFNLTLLVHP